jgi:hypothetical protein
VTSNLRSSLKLDHVQECHDLIVRKFTRRLKINFDIGLCTPFLNDLVIILILKNWNLIRNDISNEIQLVSPLLINLIYEDLLLLDFFLGLFGFLDEIFALILSLRCFLLVGDLLVDLAELHSQSIHLVIGLSPCFIKFNDLVNKCFILKTVFLRLTYFVRIPTLFFTERIYVDRHVFKNQKLIIIIFRYIFGVLYLLI